MSHIQILVVDDDPDDHLILLEYFRDTGNEQYVKFLENGQKAIDYLNSIKEEAALPRLIVLDLNMPILNGTQTLLHIKREARLKAIPVIIFSTSDNDNERRKCLSFGALDYVVKPITYDEGLVMIEKFNAHIVK